MRGLKIGLMALIVVLGMTANTFADPPPEATEAMENAQSAHDSAEVQRILTIVDRSAGVSLDAAIHTMMSQYPNEEYTECEQERIDQHHGAGHDHVADGDVYVYAGDMAEGTGHTRFSKGVDAYLGAGDYFPTPNYPAAIAWFGLAEDNWAYEADPDYVDGSCSFNLAEDEFDQLLDVVADAIAEEDCSLGPDCPCVCEICGEDPCVCE